VVGIADAAGIVGTAVPMPPASSVGSVAVGIPVEVGTVVPTGPRAGIVGVDPIGVDVGADAGIALAVGEDCEAWAVGTVGICDTGFTAEFWLAVAGVVFAGPAGPA